MATSLDIQVVANTDDAGLRRMIRAFLDLVAERNL